MPFILIYLLNLLATLPGAAFPLFLLCRTIPVARPKFYIISTMLPQILLWSINHYVVAEPLTVLELTITFHLFITASLFAPKGKKILATLCMIVYMAAMFLVTYFLVFAAQYAASRLNFPFALLTDAHTLYNAGMSLIAFSFSGPAMYLSDLLIRRTMQGLNLSKNFLLFLPVPLSQLILVNVLHRLIPYSYQKTSVTFFVIAGILFCFLADFCFYIGIKKTAQSNQLKAQIRLTEEQLELQAGYYRQLQENILTINQIRHDLSNQLQAAYYLLEQQEHGQVRSQLDQLQASIQEKVGPRYCANLMVDAVLTEKAKYCQERGIRLSINANLPGEIPVENIHLCSAFSNLLDNCIHGVAGLDHEEKYITVETVLHPSCLMIRCSNPAVKPVSGRKSNDILRSHGLGLDILKKIAEQYNGSLETDYKNGILDSTLILQFLK